MAGVPLSLPSDYWQTFSLNQKDLEFISTYLFEKEEPLTEAELVPILVHERIRRESEALVSQQKSAGKLYLPKEHYQVGETLVFPALDWKPAKLTGIRAGVNPSVGEFEVLEVEFAGGSKRQFAAGLTQHRLNEPMTMASTDPQLDPDYVLQTYGTLVEKKLTEGLEKDPDLVRVTMRWFPRALLVDVNPGLLNVAEAVLDEAGGKVLTTRELIDQLDMAGNVNPKLVEFSLNRALQEDGRFDEVGPTGEVLWYLKRLEPADVQQIPPSLRYIQIPYDRSLLSRQMLALETELDDELAEDEPPLVQPNEVTISLSYPHWRAGTLPVSARVRAFFPSAYESPRVRFTLVDGQTGEEIPAWVVRQHGYVVGLRKLFDKYGLMPGSLINLAKGKKPGQAIVTAKTRRPTRDWVRTVLVGSDGGIVFAMLKQNLTSEFNERMVIAVPDSADVDQAAAAVAKQRMSFEQLVEAIMSELIKLNVQGHVHAQEMYSALNIVRRCPPGPLLAFLTSSSKYKHVGDLHYRLAEVEDSDE